MTENLPRRHASHGKESASIRAVRNVVPDDWVFEEIDNDYGMDLRIEEFARHMPTGKQFGVQVKSSATFADGDSGFHVIVPVKSINYLIQGPLLPVLAAYDTRTKELRLLDLGEAAATLTRRRGSTWQSQDSISLEISPDGSVRTPDDFVRWTAQLQARPIGLLELLTTLRKERVAKIKSYAVVEIFAKNTKTAAQLRSAIQKGLGISLGAAELGTILAEELTPVLSLREDGKIGARDVSDDTLDALLVTLGANSAPILMAKASAFSSRRLGQAVGVAIAKGVYSVEVLSQLRDRNEAGWFSALHALLSLRPETLKGVHGASVTDEIRVDSGVIQSRSLTVFFRDPELSARHDAWLKLQSSSSIVIVDIGGKGIIVQADAVNDESAARLMYQEVKTPKGSAALSGTEENSPTKIRVKKIVGALEPDLPAAVMFSSTDYISAGPQFLGLGGLQLLEGQRLSIAEPEEDTKEFRVDGFPLIRFHFSVEKNDPRLPPEVRRELTARPVKKFLVGLTRLGRAAPSARDRGKVLDVLRAKGHTVEDESAIP